MNYLQLIQLTKRNKKRSSIYNADEIEVAGLKLPQNSPMIKNKFAKLPKEIKVDDYEEDESAKKSPKKKRKSQKLHIKSESSGSADSALYDSSDEKSIYNELEKQVEFSKQRRKTKVIQKEDKRISLPAFKPQASLNIFKILKDAIGKDLSRF